MNELKKKDNEPTDISLALIEIVKRKDIEPERLEKFLELQIKMEDRQAEKSLNGALAEFQSKCPAIVKNKSGHNCKYAPFDEIVNQIRPSLSEVGLSFSFDVKSLDDKTSQLITSIKHRDGASFTSNYFFPRIDDSGKKNASQGVKSALSYAKRAGLESALGLAPQGEDNDAQGASNVEVTQIQIDEIKYLIEKTKSDERKFFSFMKIKSLNELTEFAAKKAISILKQKMEQK